MEQTFLHGPVAASQCVLCHEGGDLKAEGGGHPGAEGPEFEIAQGGTRNLCLSCHEETMPRPLEKELHWAVACRDCHDPHGGETRILTERGGNLFCALCHRDVGEEMGGHPLPGHPVGGKPDPSNPGKELGCSSCHGAHGVRDVVKRNIVEDEREQRKFCNSCH